MSRVRMDKPHRRCRHRVQHSIYTPKGKRDRWVYWCEGCGALKVGPDWDLPTGKP